MRERVVEIRAAAGVGDGDPFSSRNTVAEGWNK
jgi:methyl coenzyme M reductase subunit C